MGRFPSHERLCFLRRQIKGSSIGDHYIRTQLVNVAEALRRIACLAHHVDIRLILQQAPQALPQ
jgi:hypothetical protein